MFETILQEFESQKMRKQLQMHNPLDFSISPGNKLDMYIFGSLENGQKTIFFH